MGFDLSLFVTAIDDELTCSICTLVLEHPLQTRCEHIFCSECIKELVEKKQSCPCDQSSLQVKDLVEPPRYFRNLLQKLEIRCKFGPQGCQTITSIEYLGSHLLNCTFNPSAVVVCDKLCKLSITRQEYQENDCHAHQAKMIKFQEDVIKRQNDEINMLRGKLQKHSQVTKDSSKTSSQSNGQQEICFRIFENFSFSDFPPVLSIKSRGFAFAQLHKSLEQTNYSFKIQILNIDGGNNSIVVGIGLTPLGHSANILPGQELGSVGAYSNGALHYNKEKTKGLPKWNYRDVIECGIKFHEFPKNIGTVYFTVNRKLISLEKNIVIPREGLFPTIYMGPKNVKDFFTSLLSTTEFNKTEVRFLTC